MTTTNRVEVGDRVEFKGNTFRPVLRRQIVDASTSKFGRSLLVRLDTPSDDESEVWIRDNQTGLTIVR